MRLKFFICFSYFLLDLTIGIAQTKPHGIEKYISDSGNISSGFQIVVFPGKRIPDSLPILRKINDSTAITVSSVANHRQGQEQFYSFPANDEWKWASKKRSSNQRQWIVKVIKEDVLFNKAESKDWKYSSLPLPNFYQLNVDYKTILKEVLPDPNIIYIDEIRTAKEEMVLNGMDYTLNGVTAANDQFSSIRGQGINLSVKENLFDTLDIDFAGRYFNSGYTPSSLMTHATTMATIIGGAGNSYYSGKGVAPGCRLTSTTFENLFPEPLPYYEENGITIQNHSYGTGIENYYGAEAVAYDEVANNIPYFLPIFSSGNSGDKASDDGIYSGVANFANLTGDFKMTKNSIVVGATDQFNQVEILSSRGPAFDGRVKPELVAFGKDGSSGAAALISGAAALLQQRYKAKRGQVPASALVKAILINSANDVGRENVDYESGFGSLNVLKALNTLDDERFFYSEVAVNDEVIFELDVPSEIKLLKITLCWNDPAGGLNSNKALVNDLDLKLSNELRTQAWLPWVLDPAPSVTSLSALPFRKRDSLNNVEQITLSFPAEGRYEISIIGNDLSQSPQPFAIAYEMIKENQFEWTFPTKDQNLIAGEDNIIRWQASSTAEGLIELSIDEGITWKAVDTVELEEEASSIKTPSQFGTGILRMRRGEKYTYSDTFTISRRLETSVVYNCQDSILISWEKAEGVSHYQLFSLDKETFKPLTIVGDTSIVLKDSPNNYLAVAPLILNKSGIKSYGFDFTTQGAGCFINGLVADLIDEDYIELKASIGGLPFIKTLTFQKISANTIVDLQSFDSPEFEEINYQDYNLVEGINKYQLKVVLNNDQTIYSERVELYHFQNSDYIVSPNPLSSNGVFQVLSKDNEEAFIEIYSATGQKLLEKRLEDQLQSISLNTSFKGLYLYRILKRGKKEATGKLILE